MNTFAKCFYFTDESPSAGCPMSEWSVWSQCSCLSQRQQRYRVALSPATRGQQCAPVETQSRPCSHSQCDGELTSLDVQIFVCTMKSASDPVTVTQRHTGDKTILISVLCALFYLDA